MYSIGSVYCGVKGITNSSLQEYSKAFRTSSQFRQSVWGMGKGKYQSITPFSNQATFWSGLGKDGATIAENYVKTQGRQTMEILMDENGLFSHEYQRNWNWGISSATMAQNSSGNAIALMGDAVKQTGIWNTVERIILNINPKVTSISIVQYTTGISELVQKTFSLTSLWTGTAGVAETIISIVTEKSENARRKK